MAATNKDGSPRKPRTTKKASSSDVEIVSALSNHLRFVACAHNDKGEPYARHCIINGGAVMAFNGVIAAGVRIEEQITAAPDTLQLRKAIERAGSQYVMTIEANRLTIKSGKFRASIPILDPAMLPQITPDACQWPLNNAIRDALKAASAFASDNAPTVVMASLQLTNGTVAGTDRNVILEFYHGNSMPELCVPREFATAIVKCDKEIIGFGYTPDVSVTFWFADGSFIKTQLYQPGWPESWRNALPPNNEGYKALPDVFWQAYDAIADFSEDDLIRFGPELAHSHMHPAEGATFEMKDQTFNWCLNIRRLKMIRPYVKAIGDLNAGHVLGFFGDNVRGAIALNVEKPEQQAPKPAEAPQDDPHTFVADAAGASEGSEPQFSFPPQATGIADAYAETAANTAGGDDGWGAR